MSAAILCYQCKCELEQISMFPLFNLFVSTHADGKTVNKYAKMNSRIHGLVSEYVTVVCLFACACVLPCRCVCVPAWCSAAAVCV